MSAPERIRLKRPDQEVGARTRLTRFIATQHYAWENVVVLSDPTKKHGYLVSLTPAAAEDLGNELLQVARTARAGSET